MYRGRSQVFRRALVEACHPLAPLEGPVEVDNARLVVDGVGESGLGVVERGDVVRGGRRPDAPPDDAQDDDQRQGKDTEPHAHDDGQQVHGGLLLRLLQTDPLHVIEEVVLVPGTRQA